MLLDIGDWYYLQHGVLMKDRATTLTSHRTPHYGLLERVRNQEYSRILVHLVSGKVYSYDMGKGDAFQKEILAHYREVRRIPRVAGMECRMYYWMMLSEISVLEPIPQASPANVSPAPARGP